MVNGAGWTGLGCTGVACTEGLYACLSIKSDYSVHHQQLWMATQVTYCSK